MAVCRRTLALRAVPKCKRPAICSIESVFSRKSCDDWEESAVNLFEELDALRWPFFRGNETQKWLGFVVL